MTSRAETPMDEQKLRALAEAATPIETELYGDRYFHGGYSTTDLTKAQDDFFTAANPAAILALLDELQTLREERTAWRVSAENAEPDGLRYREMFRSGVDFCFMGETYKTKAEADAAIDAAIKGES